MKFQVLTKSGKCSLVSSGFPPLQPHILPMHVPHISNCIHQEAPCCAGIFSPSLLWNPSGRLKLLTFIIPWDLSCFPFLQQKGQLLFEIQTNLFLQDRTWNFPFCCSRCVPPVPIRLFKNPSSLVCLKCPTLVTNPVYQSKMLYDWGFYNLWHLSSLSDTNDWTDCTHSSPLALAGDQIQK